MSPRGILITFVIISLLLLGVMFLAIDGRNHSIIKDFETLDEQFQQENAKYKEVEIIPEKHPEELQKFHTVSEALVQYIENLKRGIIVKADDGFEAMDAKQNDIFFVNNTDTYTEQATQFITHIEAYEKVLAAVHSKFPETKNVSSQIRELIQDKDWLHYNFKDFPAIAIYTKLTAMENDIQTNQKDIFTLMLSAE